MAVLIYKSGLTCKPVAAYVPVEVIERAKALKITVAPVLRDALIAEVERREAEMGDVGEA